MRFTNLFKSSLVVLALSAYSLGAEKAKPVDTKADDSTAKSAAIEHPEKVVFDAATAFEFLKSLTGNWEQSGGEHDHGSKSHTISYRPTAAGSAVMETIFEGDPMEMISMYHMNGDELLLTHYCALQNAPVLKFEKSDKPGEIKFVFQGGTNFDPTTDMHMHEGVYRIKDANTIEAAFVGWSDGKAGECSTATRKRVASSEKAAK